MDGSGAPDQHPGPAWALGQAGLGQVAHHGHRPVGQGVPQAVFDDGGEGAAAFHGGGQCARAASLSHRRSPGEADALVGAEVLPGGDGHHEGEPVGERRRRAVPRRGSALGRRRPSRRRRRRAGSWPPTGGAARRPPPHRRAVRGSAGTACSAGGDGTGTARRERRIPAPHTDAGVDTNRSRSPDGSGSGIPTRSS